jgi:DHA3 family macrolide efflux protein-like MFS transporter
MAMPPGTRSVPAAVAAAEPAAAALPPAVAVPEVAVPREASASRVPPSGMNSFMVLWFGQMISVLGTNLSGFSLGVWVFQRTRSVTQFAFIALVTTLPGILISPLAGALVDRWDRRWTMVLSDGVAALATLTIGVLLFIGQLDLWVIYAAMSVSATSSAFRLPAYSAATAQLLPKGQLARAASLRNLSLSASNLIAPWLGGALLVALGIRGVILVDFATFVFAVAATLLVRVPRLAVGGGTAARPSLWQDAAEGWRFVRQRQGLFIFLLLSAVANLAVGLVEVLAPPMVLAYASAAQLGVVLSIAGAGTLVGSLLMGLWKGTRRLIEVNLAASVICGVCIAFAGWRPSLILVAAAGFGFFFFFAVAGVCGQALWQVKVAPELQGRIFSIRRMIGWSTFPLAYAAAGPLADRLFEPLLAKGGPLSASIGPLLGTGRGRGIGLLLVLTGLLLALTHAAAYLSPRLRHVERELPDMLAD